MKLLQLLFLATFLILFSCEYRESTTNETEDSNVIVEIISHNDSLNSDLNSEIDTEIESGIKEDDELYNDSLKIVYAKFKSANMYEGDIDLIFEDDSGKEYYFAYYSIDPVKEGLYTMEESEESIFYKIVISPEIKDITFKIYYTVEYFQGDLADEYDYHDVIKKIERLN